MGTEYSVTTGRFQEAKLHWPLAGSESWKATVASVPWSDTEICTYPPAATRYKPVGFSDRSASGLSQPLQKGLEQLFRLDRFADMVVHARRDTDLAIIVEGAGGRDGDEWLKQGSKRTYLDGSAEPFIQHSNIFLEEIVWFQPFY